MIRTQATIKKSLRIKLNGNKKDNKGRKKRGNEQKGRLNLKK